MTHTMTTPTSVTGAERALNALKAEQRSIPEAITTARRAGDVSAVMAAEQRREDLPADIERARVDLLRAQLEERWLEAERAAKLEQAAKAAHTEASAALQRYRDEWRPADTPAGVAQAATEAARLSQNLHETKKAWEDLRHPVLLALCEVDNLEAAITAATGQPPAPGEGLRAPVGLLAANFLFRDPRLGTDDYQSGFDAPVCFTAGTAPPRWVAYQLADSAHAWQVEA